MKFDNIEKYSIFAINNLNMKNADCEGNMAVGKNITLENFSIGIGYAPTNTSQNSDALVVGGILNIKNSVNYSGNTIVQKNRTPKNLKMSSPKGTVVLKKVLDFQECYNFLKDISVKLKERSSNALVECIGKNSYELVSVFKNEVQVFNLDLGEEQVEELHIYLMVDNRSPVIINVSNEKIVLKSIKVYFNNQPCSDGICSRILWNFYNAKEITILNSKFYGTIFAVESAIYLKNSLLVGNVFGSDIYGDSDVVLCRLDIGICRYLSELNRYNYESFENNIKLKNKFIDPYYSKSNTVTSGISNSITSQSSSKSGKTINSQSITKAITTMTKSYSNSVTTGAWYMNEQFIDNSKKEISRKDNSNKENLDFKVKEDNKLNSQKIDNLPKLKEVNYKSDKVKSSEVQEITKTYEEQEDCEKVKINDNEVNNDTEVNYDKEICGENFVLTKTKISTNNIKNIEPKKIYSEKVNSYKKNSKDINDEVILNMLNSIAQVEEGISEILKAEAFKIKKSVELAESVEDYVRLDESLSKTVRGLNNIHSLLQYKFDEVMKICDK